MTSDGSHKKMKTWTFVVERDIEIEAYNETEAEIKFRDIYGNRPILALIRPRGDE